MAAFYRSLLFLALATTMFACATTVKIPNGYSANQWAGESKTGAITADFRGLNGKKSLPFHFTEEGTYLVKYRFESTGGYMNIEMRTDTQSVLTRRIEGVMRDSVFFAYGKGQNYQLVVGGLNANGRVDVSYRIRK